MRRQVEITFAAGGNSDAFIAGGWAEPERHGRWTTGTLSVLRVPELDPNASYACPVTLGPYIRQPSVPAQDLVVTMHGHEVLRARMTAGGTIAFDLPVELVQLFPVVEIAFEMPLAACPQALGGSTDTTSLRELSS